MYVCMNVNVEVKNGKKLITSPDRIFQNLRQSARIKMCNYESRVTDLWHLIKILRL